MALERTYLDVDDEGRITFLVEKITSCDCCGGKPDPDEGITLQRFSYQENHDPHDILCTVCIEEG